MKPSTSFGLAAAAFVALTVLPGEVEAGRFRIPIPIIYGSDEKIIHVTDLPPDIRQAVSQKLEQDVAVGFYYKRCHIFWLDVWTWGHLNCYNPISVSTLHVCLCKLAIGFLSVCEGGRVIAYFYGFPHARKLNPEWYIFCECGLDAP